MAGVTRVILVVWGGQSCTLPDCTQQGWGKTCCWGETRVGSMPGIYSLAPRRKFWKVKSTTISVVARYFWVLSLKSQTKKKKILQRLSGGSRNYRKKKKIFVFCACLFLTSTSSELKKGRWWDWMVWFNFFPLGWQELSLFSWSQNWLNNCRVYFTG